MSRHLARRSRHNPMSPVGSAVTNNVVLGGGGAAVGAAMGTTGARGSAAWNGAGTGLGLATLGGMVVGFLSPRHREAAFATAGVGFVGLIGVGLWNKYGPGSTTSSSTTTTTTATA